MTSATAKIDLGTSSGPWYVIWGCAILVLGCGMRVWNLDSQCLSHDEVVEVQAIQRPFQEFLWEKDGFPPLHRVLLWGLMQVLSMEFAGRWLSVVLGVVTIGLLYDCGRSLAGISAGLWTATLAALSPLLIHYSQEGRAYGLYLAGSALVLGAFLRALRDDGCRDWVIFVLGCLVAEWTHYYFTIWMLLCGLLWLAERVRFGRWSRGLTAFLVLAAAQLAIWPVLRGDLEGSVRFPEQTRASLLAIGYTFYSLVGGHCLGPSLAKLHELAPREALAGFAPYIGVYLALLARPFVLGLRQLARAEPRAFWCLVGLSFVPPLLAGLAAMVLNLNYHPRYVSPSVLPLTLILGIGLHSIRSLPWRIGVIAALAVLTCWGLWLRNYHWDYQNEDLRGAAVYIASQGEATDSDVFVNVGYMKRPLAYYLGSSWQVTEIPEAGNPNGVFRDAQDARNCLRRVAQSPRLHRWVVTTRTFHGDPERWLSPDLMAQEGVGLAAEFPGVQVYRYQGKASP